MQKPMQLEIVNVMVEEKEENVQGQSGRALVELVGKGGVLKSGKSKHQLTKCIGTADEIRWV